MNFGQKLRQLRKQKGLTQQQLARKLGYKTNSYISDVESGHFIPSREKLKRLLRLWEFRLEFWMTCSWNLGLRL